MATFRPRRGVPEIKIKSTPLKSNKVISTQIKETQLDSISLKSNQVNSYQVKSRPPVPLCGALTARVCAYRAPSAYRTVPYHTASCPNVPYRIKPYGTIPYRTIRYHTVPSNLPPFRTVPHRNPVSTRQPASASPRSKGSNGVVMERPNGGLGRTPTNLPDVLIVVRWLSLRGYDTVQQAQ